MQFSSAPFCSLRMTWKQWVFLYCRRLWNQPSPVRRARLIDRTRKLSFPHCYKARFAKEGSRRHLNLVGRLFLASRLRRIRAALQSLELLHFTLCGCRFSLFPVETCQPEVCLRRQRTILFNRKELGPFFLGSGGIALQRSSFPQRIECLRHVWHQLVGAQKFRPRLVHFALFQQSCSETVNSLSISGLQLGLRPKFLLGFRPLESAGIHFAQLKMYFRQIRPQPQRVAILLLGFRHLAQYEVVLSHRLMCARRVGVSSQQSVDRLF